jgi:tetratricopeptide (TPR) repeat protein
VSQKQHGRDTNPARPPRVDSDACGVDTAPRPSRSLILLIVAITVVPLGTLLWVGWRPLEQDRLLEAQQAQQRVERAADLAVGALQRAISSSERRLAADEETWPNGAVALTIRGDRIDVSPKGRVAFLPVVPPHAEPPPAIFARGDDLEFRQRDHAAAGRFYRDLARSSAAAVRAEALLRLGRNLQAAARTDEALDAYSKLGDVRDASIAAYRPRSSRATRAAHCSKPANDPKSCGAKLNS